MYNENTLRVCPICNRTKLKHKLGTKKYYCPNCRIFLYKTGTTVYTKTNGRSNRLVAVDAIKEKLNTKVPLAEKDVKTVFKLMLNKNENMT